MDFTNLAYLESGNARQQQVFQLLDELRIFEYLSDYQPLLTGTVPLGIDVPTSDLDISCEVYNAQLFISQVTEVYGKLKGFRVLSTDGNTMGTTLIQFCYQKWPIELFGQPLPPAQQQAYRHMLVEHRLLQLGNSLFREQIIKLKRQGVKTEPAFAQLLALPGNPYQALLYLENYSDEQLRHLLSQEGYTGK